MAITVGNFLLVIWGIPAIVVLMLCAVGLIQRRMYK